jgi:hypothetical protein
MHLLVRARAYTRLIEEKMPLLLISLQKRGIIDANPYKLDWRNDYGLRKKRYR